jgi:hypothetical protein
MALSRRVAIAAAFAADAGCPARAARAADAALPAAGVGRIGRCRNALFVLNSDIAAVAAIGTVAASASIAAVTALTTVLVIFAAIAVAAVATGTACAACPAPTTGPTAAATRVDIYTGYEFRDGNGQRAAILSRKAVGTVGTTGSIIASTTRGAGIIAIPMADGILSLSASSAYLAGGSVMAIAARIAMNIDIIRLRHDDSPIFY